MKKLVYALLKSSFRYTSAQTIKIRKINTFSKVLTMHQITCDNDRYLDQSPSKYYQMLNHQKTLFVFEKQGHNGYPEHRRQIKWKMQEKIKHLAFLYYTQFPSQKVEGRSSWQIFKKMATFIKTKNSNQCRIYHKRSMNKYKTIYNFLSEIRKQVPELKSILQAYKGQLFGIEAKINQEIAAEILRTNSEEKDNNAHKILIKDEEEMQFPKVQTQLFYNNKIQDEKYKIDNLKTDITLQEKDVKEIRQRKSFQLPSTLEQPLLLHPFKSFQLTPPNFQQNNFQFFAGISHASSLKLNSSDYCMISKKQRVMRECHQLFLAYTTKLAQFMNLQ